MPTLKEIAEARRAEINAHRVFWEKVEALHHPARGFIKIFEAAQGDDTVAINEIVLDALDRLKTAMYEVVGCD